MLKISSKDFKVDNLIQPLEIVALRGNIFQTLVDIEKPRLPDHPQHYQSGETDRVGSISCAGNSSVRGALFVTAHVMILV